MKPEVSVVVMLYNPNPEKLWPTLSSILSQKEIAWELVLADDGSRDPKESEIRGWLAAHGCTDYTYLLARENQGTVKNCLDGCTAAQAPYIYVISAGDYLYDDTTLRDICAFAKENAVDFCCGKARYYSIDDEKNVTYYPGEFPRLPQAFAKEGYDERKARLSFYYGNQIVGSAFLRKRERIIRYLTRIAGKVRYIEDTSTAAMYLADGDPLYLMDRYVVMYEYGVGISTDGGGVWAKRLQDDTDAARDILLADHPNDRELAARHAKRTPVNLVRYADVYVRELMIKRAEKAYAKEIGR